MAKIIKIGENTPDKNIVKTTQKTSTFEFCKINKKIEGWQFYWSHTLILRRL